MLEEQHTASSEQLENVKVQRESAKEQVTRPFTQEEKLKTKPAEEALEGPDSKYLDGLDLDSLCPSENEYMRRHSVVAHAHHIRSGLRDRWRS